MQFSARVTKLTKLYNIKPKDVLFSMLISAGATIPEAYAAIYRPAEVTNTALSYRAAQFMGQNPGIKLLIDELTKKAQDSENPTPKKGRPKKSKEGEAPEEAPSLDYTDKDAVLKELARIAERSEKESDKLAAIREISALQRMKQEAAVEDEKRVTFYLPLNYARADELLNYLKRYYEEKDRSQSSETSALLQ